MEAEGTDRTRARAGAADTAKPRAAASLTADIVARGRHRTQDYGEAGLWRGAKAPLPTEAPVRVAFPRARGERDAEVEEAPETSRAASTAVVPGERRAEQNPAAASGSMDDLAPLLFASVALFLAVFFVGLLFF